MRLHEPCAFLVTMRTHRRPRTALAALGLLVAVAGLVAGQGPALAVEGSWEPTGSLNVPRLQLTATLLPNGRVLVAGGRNFAFTQAFNSAELYDPITETFTLTGSMTDTRWSHTATLLPNGKVLVAGGFTNPSTNQNAQPVLASAELYDPATGTWTPTGSMSTRRALHVAQLLPNGKVLVAGGRTCNLPPPTNAQVAGSATVQPGGALVMTNGLVTGGVQSTGAAGVRICGSRIRGAAGGGPALSVANSYGSVVVGDGTPACARNDLLGAVSFDANQSVELDTNRVSGSVSVTRTAGGIPSAVLAANQISGGLACSDNTPPPTNDGRPNTVIGARSGQCGAAGF